ncbi:hypothetical protein LWI29_012709 [Acer saccharum]|uniref:Uncharacterized protein n=1 Tax=Acer saccharum TaxID=4024 RepID=A0AA39RWQ6_ACESA|nr:hypothetical protein LWI29_012709 [Acer saccharum]
MWCYKVGGDESGVVVYTEPQRQQANQIHFNIRESTHRSARLLHNIDRLSSAQHRSTLFCPAKASPRQTCLLVRSTLLQLARSASKDHTWCCWLLPLGTSRVDS